MILGGCRQDGDWNEEVDMKMARGIMERCCKLASELGEVDDLQVISYNVGLRREYFLSLCFGSELSLRCERTMLKLGIASRKGGIRVELEKLGNGIPVVHNYGHSGAGYQSSW